MVECWYWFSVKAFIWFQLWKHGTRLCGIFFKSILSFVYESCLVFHCSWIFVKKGEYSYFKFVCALLCTHCAGMSNGMFVVWILCGNTTLMFLFGYITARTSSFSIALAGCGHLWLTSASTTYQLVMMRERFLSRALAMMQHTQWLAMATMRLRALAVIGAVITCHASTCLLCSCTSQNMAGNPCRQHIHIYRFFRLDTEVIGSAQCFF